MWRLLLLLLLWLRLCPSSGVFLFQRAACCLPIQGDSAVERRKIRGDSNGFDERGATNHHSVMRITSKKAHAPCTFHLLIRIDAELTEIRFQQVCRACQGITVHALKFRSFKMAAKFLQCCWLAGCWLTMKGAGRARQQAGGSGSSFAILPFHFRLES